MTNLFIDCETTGVKIFPTPEGPKSEIVSISILDEDENVLLDTLVRPVYHTSWEKATEVNGITPEMVKDAPTYEELSSKIREIVKDNTIFAYNMSFEQNMIPEIHDCTLRCSMREFSDYNNSKWLKLNDVCEIIGFDLGENAHDSKWDTLALIAVKKFLDKNR